MEISDNQWQNITILIVEDDNSSSFFLNALLNKTGAKIINATDGESAIKAVKENPEIDLVLMDIQLPNIDGLTATKEIKKLRGNLPVIAQTAHALDEDKQQCLKAGCNDYITKPIDKDQFYKILERFLR